MSEQGAPPDTTGFQFDAELFESSVVHKNVAQEIVVTTEDKIRLCLIEYKDVLNAKTDWIAPAGILAALITTLVAADFRQFLGLSSEVWRALFMIGSMISAFSLLRALYTAIKYRGYDRIESIIKKLKHVP